MGRMELAFALAEKAVTIAAETERPYDLSYAHAAQGLAFLTVSDPDNAITHLESALRIARANEIMLLIPHVARYLGRAYILTGQLHSARILLAETVDQAERQSLKALKAWCAASLGHVQLLDGEFDEAKQSVTAALAFAREKGYRPLQVYATRLLGLISARNFAATGFAQQAMSKFKDAATVAELLGMTPELAHCCYAMGDLLARTGHVAEARSELTRALKLYQSSGMIYDAKLVQAAVTRLNEDGAIPSGRSGR
jgi:tetratricopeptide (TPR) repeat protein